MVPIESKEPFELISMDFLGPFVKSRNGNRHIVVATDHFTKWSEARAIPAQNKIVCQFCCRADNLKARLPKDNTH